MDKLYADHFYEKDRIKIAAQLLQKELAKLLPSLSSDHYRSLHGDIAQWFAGEGAGLAPVHDFWNAFDAIMDGVKITNTMRFVTAENVDWKRQDVPLADMRMGKLPLLKGLKLATYRTDEIRQAFEQDPKAREAIRETVSKALGHVGSDPDMPIVLLAQQGHFKTIDGNHRILRAILDDAQTISAWVGTMDGDKPSGYWVPTNFMRGMIITASSAVGTDQEEALYEACKTFLACLIGESPVAGINFKLRLAKSGPPDPALPPYQQHMYRVSQRLTEDLQIT